ncbi:MAG: 50S ribosomal protein L9 [Armatimonadota bacterium]|nr:50S ribosomal protein L9 [Armatimonadota bacterium]
MKAILIRDVNDLGKTGDVVNVADGYARNYLIPRKLAIEATNGSLRALDQQHALESKKSEKLTEDAQALGARLGEISVTIIGKVGQGTRLYGSVTGQDIADALKAQHKIEIDKRKIDVLDPIKTLGSYDIPVRLQRTVTANLKVEVVSELGPAPKPKEKPKAKAEPVAEVEPVVEAALVVEPVAEEVAVEPAAQEETVTEPEAQEESTT